MSETFLRWFFIVACLSVVIIVTTRLIIATMQFYDAAVEYFKLSSETMALFKRVIESKNLDRQDTSTLSAAERSLNVLQMHEERTKSK